MKPGDTVQVTLEDGRVLNAVVAAVHEDDAADIVVVLPRVPISPMTCTPTAAGFPAGFIGKPGHWHRRRP